MTSDPAKTFVELTRDVADCVDPVNREVLFRLWRDHLPLSAKGLEYYSFDDAGWGNVVWTLCRREGGRWSFGRLTPTVWWHKQSFDDRETALLALWTELGCP